MNSHDLKKLRGIFDEEMAKEGFVWRYQVYMHVDFDQHWIFAVWPKVFGAGHFFNLQYGLCLFNMDNMDDMKSWHSCHWANMFYKLFDCRTIPETVDEHLAADHNLPRDLWATVENYQLCYHYYYRDASPVIHMIRSPYDAVSFIKNYCNICSPDGIPLSLGQELIQYLMVYDMQEEAKSILPMINYRQTDLEHRFSQEKFPVYTPPSPLGYTKKQYQRLVEVMKTHTELEVKSYYFRKKQLEENKEAIKALENQLLEGNCEKMIEDTKQKIQEWDDQLRMSFRKEELQIMQTNW